MSARAKMSFSVVLLLCVSSVLAQTRESPFEPIRSALRTKDFDKAIASIRLEIELPSRCSNACSD